MTSSILEFFKIVNLALALPATVIFLFAGIFFTFKTGFMQFRGLPRFFKILKGGVQEDKHEEAKTLSSTHALLTAMATTLGMGNIIGPSVAVLTGGPGALFWLLVYSFFSSATKFVEVTFAIRTRERTKEGRIVGGPTEYLNLVHKGFGLWYGVLTMFLFPGWAALQANTLAEILSYEGVPSWVTGLALAVVLVMIVFGGISRVASVASKLVPIMFFLYVVFAFSILISHIGLVGVALKMIMAHVFTPCAPMGAFVGATIYMALSSGVYRGIYITEAGIGTSSIPHALADVKRATDQGILAMFSVAADATLSLVSGLLVLVTGIWFKTQFFTTALMYHVFKTQSPFFGKYVLILSVTLLVFTTILGNSFNGIQNFFTFFRVRGVKLYYLFLGLLIFLGAIAQVRMMWDIMDILLALVAIPHLIGLIILSFTHGKMLKD